MPSALSELLMARVSGSVLEDLARMPGLEDVLGKLVDAGERATGLRVAGAEWVAFVARYLEPGDVREQLSRLPAPDVHVAIACTGGDRAAHEQLDVRIRTASKQALAGLRLVPADVDEVLQSVRTRLLIGGAQGKLATYAGRGPLDGWLRLTIARAGLSWLRARPHDAPGNAVDEDSAMIEVAGAEDPQLAAIRARCAPALKHAVERAIAGLSDEERTLLRLHYVDRLSIDDLATILHAHRATAARRLARARAAVVEGARQGAIAALGVSAAELESLGGLLVSQLDLTLQRVLQASAAQANG